MPWTPRSRFALQLTAALMPWSWFVVRDLVPEFDAFAIGMPVLLFGVVAGVLLLADYRRSFALALMGSALATVGVLAIVGPWFPQGGPPPVDGMRLVAANLAGQEHEVEAALDDLRRERADVLVLSELGRWTGLGLHPSYVHRVTSERRTSVAVYARWPLTRIEDAPEAVLRFGVAVEVSAPHGTFVLYALHLPRPWPTTSRSSDTSLREHRALIDELVEAVRAETRPVVIVGDLNLSDRSGGFRALTAELKDAMRTTWTGPSSIRWGVLLLRIDHILVPATWCADGSRRFGIAGSDHYGVSSLVGRCDGAVDEVVD